MKYNVLKAYYTERSLAQCFELLKSEAYRWTWCGGLCIDRHKQSLPFLLSAVKAYIDQNQHLPEIPSAQEIAKDGLNLGEMNKLLLKKVEELTLYLIEKDSEIKEQKATVNKLQEQVTQLVKEVNRAQ